MDCLFTWDFFLKNFVLFIPSAVISGFLYVKVLLKLRDGLQNEHKVRISRMFATLYGSWVLFNLPFLLFELAMFLPFNRTEWVNGWDYWVFSLDWTAHQVGDYTAYLFQV